MSAAKAPGLTFEPVIASSHESGRRCPAGVAQCGHCGGQKFAVLRIKTTDHPHLCCHQCGATFCYGQNVCADDRLFGETVQ